MSIKRGTVHKATEAQEPKLAAVRGGSGEDQVSRPGGRWD